MKNKNFKTKSINNKETIIVGGTSTGKTSLLNLYSNNTNKIIVIESYDIQN